METDSGKKPAPGLNGVARNGGLPSLAKLESVPLMLFHVNFAASLAEIRPLPIEFALKFGARTSST